jgi:hypothetical protein
MSKRGLPLPDSDVFAAVLVPDIKILRAAKKRRADTTSSIGSSESSCSSTDVNGEDASSDSDDRVIVIPNQGSPKKSCLKSATPPEKMITKRVNLLQSPGLHMDTHIHTHTHIYTQAHIRAHTHTHTHTHTHMHTHSHIHTHTHTQCAVSIIEFEQSVNTGIHSSKFLLS